MCYSGRLLKRLKEPKTGRTEGGWTERSRLREFERERERELLSKNTSDPTVGSLRDKKENCSTWRGLRVDTGFVSF